MALMAALTLCLHHVAGFTNKTLRPVVATFLDTGYSATQMTYCGRLRGTGLVRRLPGTHTHVLTPDGIRVAAFFTKTYRRVIDPLFAAADPIARCGPDRDLRAALATIDRTIERYVQDTGIAA